MQHITLLLSTGDKIEFDCESFEGSLQNGKLVSYTINGMSKSNTGNPVYISVSHIVAVICKDIDNSEEISE